MRACWYGFLPNLAQVSGFAADFPFDFTYICPVVFTPGKMAKQLHTAPMWNESAQIRHKAGETASSSGRNLRRSCSISIFQPAVTTNVFAVRPAIRLLLTFFLFPFSAIRAQTPLPPDSVFPVLSFLEGIARNHPLVRQANLLDEAALAEIRQARGQFDPKLEGRFLRKSYDGKEYFNLLNPELKIPTLPGIDLKAGYERNTGIYVNGEDQTPAAGLRYIGLNLPLARGLLTDARRNALRQAQEARNLNTAEMRKAVNKIMFQATKDYFEWYSAYFQLLNHRLALQLAATRYEAVLRRIRIGELPRVDSLEAGIFVQDRQINLNQAFQDEQNARLVLSAYLWSDDGQPMELLPGLKPGLPGAWMQMPDEAQVNTWTEQALQNHPELQKFQVKTRLLELDRRLAFEMLKPSINLQYNWLSAPNPALWYDSPVDRNYKLGLDFSMPLFLRKERGKLGLVKTKLLQNRLETDQISRNIRVDIASSRNQLLALTGNLQTQRQMVENYDKLLQAEIRKFGIGESSLFLINSREAKLIESRIKQISMEAKFQKERAALQYATGRTPLSP